MTKHGERLQLGLYACVLLDPNTIGEGLMVNARRVDRLLERFAVDQVPVGDLEHSGWDARAAWRTEHEDRLSGRF